jgi:hypothetical protein
MSTDGMKESSGFGSVCYWFGVAMALGCLIVAVAANTRLFWDLEHAAVPLSWLLAGLAAIGFLAAELADAAPAHPARESSENEARLSPEWETVAS